VIVAAKDIDWDFSYEHADVHQPSIEASTNGVELRAAYKVETREVGYFL
jgi:hypothetical protein